MASSTHRDPSIVDPPRESEHDWIPDGCVSLVGPDGQRYVVPDFMVPAMRQVVEGKKKKEDLMAFGASGTKPAGSSSSGSTDIFCAGRVIGIMVSGIIGPGMTMPSIRDTSTFALGTNVRAITVMLTIHWKVHEFNSPLFDIIREGKVMAPTVPGSSDREQLSAHSEVLVLQERLGILYKDAAHCLYMAELEKVKTDQKMYKAFTHLRGSTEETLAMAYQLVKVIQTTGPYDGAGSS
ncbi:hypothetical protein BYT27DRAFT_7257400 [Phlegmacium glaucopus]|nr:hypothetical protein BYT27DRAFT_7257400 [Phlegmacium glaucopus]